MKADELVDLLKAEFSLDDKTQAAVVDEEVSLGASSPHALGWWPGSVVWLFTWAAALLLVGCCALGGGWLLGRPFGKAGVGCWPTRISKERQAAGRRGCRARSAGHALVKARSIYIHALPPVVLTPTPHAHSPRSAAPQMLDQILDRSHLAQGKQRPYAEQGLGYEVVQQLEGSGLLQGVE